MYNDVLGYFTLNNTVEELLMQKSGKLYKIVHRGILHKSIKTF